MAAASWKKVIVSGSIAELNNLSVDNNVNVSGSLNVGPDQQIGQSSAKLSGSFSGSFSGALTSSLSNTNHPNIVSYDVATGTFAYQGTGSFTATSASYAFTASYVNPLTQSVFIDGNLAITGSNNYVAVDEIYSGDAATSSPSNRILTKNTNIGFGGIGDVVIYASTENVVLSAGPGKAVEVTGSLVLGGGATGSFTGSFSGEANASGSFSGSFFGDGGGLTNISASSIVGLQLNQIGSGSATASISPDNGLQINVSTVITGSLTVSGSTGSSFDLNADTFIFTGSMSTSGSLNFTGLSEVSQSYVLAYDAATGQVTYQTAADQATTASYAIEAGKVTNALSQGTGIESFNYDGSSTATVAVSGAAALSANVVTKWSGDAFVDSSITDSANVTINNAGGVLVQTGGLYVTGSSTFHDNLVVQGNFTVQGTASFQNTTNLEVADQFILLNSGSNTFQDSGIVINTGNSANSGSAFFLETAGTTVGTTSQNGRFAVAGNVLPDATAVTAEEYAVTAQINTGAPSAVPQFGGTNLGQGNMFISTDTNDIWIYA